ncbi:pyridoxamine 5'-phosphate oxidase family protein [Micromonospora sp. NPDC007271]|uniref:pyridoxamine 5'-phosphate oxidase family protein n=1 Tax=Micromonospora sp. NPDC007271 TaxID=3154587 RepID=UPI0033FAE5C2
MTIRETLRARRGGPRDVDEPHAMTVSTLDADGAPDARVPILKDLDDEGWHLATTATSAKGRQLAGNPVSGAARPGRRRR